MKLAKKMIIVVVLVILSIATFYIGTGYTIFQEAIQNNSLEEKVNEIRAKAYYTKLEEMPTIYKEAVICVEDHRFYEHNGIDIIAIGRAFLKDIRALEFVEGGSTITQQLAKNMYFTQEKKITRKVAEVFMAWELEKDYTKDEILELYLNTSYFGEGCYTVKEASQTYFKKEPKDMSSKECIILAGIPNAPSVYAPTKNLTLTNQRKKQVIERMLKNNKLTKEEAQKLQEP